ncbi:TonB-dependent receptor [Dyadobacter sp. CY323]|uniref:SusC/RagA family TonB-linked outer membrane protein n=1 Tax=Dyadobacter sp. CY323 TaxID=2907302 RepID=UPI001F478BFD|nr:TonB-dependent receptor [Dyadobacter sp. CY323]MCE6991437.1 TonB-dependent receptor [Dyadobacter sp. CY323]
MEINSILRVLLVWWLCLFLTDHDAKAQARIVRGKVTDGRDNTPLPGVTVREQGGSSGSLTDVDGGYSIPVAGENAVLVFSFVGMNKKEEPVGSRTTIDVALTADDRSLDELVVIGYGVVKKRDLTGSVSSVKGSDLTAYTVPDPIMGLQGRTPGVQISQNTGAPDGDFSVRIRGINSIKGNNAPLYVVDGIPFSNYTVNTYDIESIEILKDASATAIYGSRGANGVVIITTKRGKSGKTNISYNFDYGIQSQLKKLDLMNAQEWGNFYNEYLVNSNTLDQPAFTDAQIAAMGKGTDWQDLMLNNAPISNHNLTFSGGVDKIKYHISGSAMMRDGLISNSAFNKYNVRSTLDFNPNKYLDMAVQLGYSKVDRMNQSDNGGVGGSSMIAAIYSASPAFTPYDEKGGYKDLRSWYSWSSHELKNPLIMANESKYRTNSNISNLNTSLNFKPFNGLSIKSSVGIENSDSRYDAYTTSRFIYQNNSASVNHSRYTNFTNENIINYNLDFNKIHSFNFMVGQTYQQSVSQSLAASGNTFLSDLPATNDLATAAIINTPSTSYSKWALMSYLGRVNYSYKGKYLATASVRTDGSSRYSPGQQWGYFPSAALAWRVSEESFMTSVQKLSDLKIRASFGKTGSTAIDPYSTQNLLFAGKAATGNGNFTYYAPGSTYPGALKWETTTQFDLGFDLAMFNNRLNITGDYYYKYTTDLLSTVFLPSSSGFISSTQNIGRMDNTGVELAIEGVVIDKPDFQFTSSFNISHNKNKVVKLAEGDDILGTTYSNYGSGSITIIREGEPLGAFYLYKDAGLNETGQLSYEDVNGDGLYTDKDDRYLAGSPYPDFIYGLTLDFRYKNWALNALLQGSQGNKVFNLSEMRNYSYSQGMNVARKVYYESWREGQDNSNANYPKIERAGTLRYSDRFLENGSYLRLKNISLAYHIPIPQSLTWIRSASVFVSAQNYLTFTKYTGLDPEVSSKGGDINGAIDHFTYPNSKTFSFGAKIQF